jgi:flavin reductase (DIM6/NTAB) family NADH-FMN oxidoreductase RutF
MTDYHSFSPPDHGLPFSPYKGLIAPRPIGWISTYSKDGVANLAPYSYFQALSDKPPIIMFVSDGWKQSAQNAQDTGCFVHNVVDRRYKAEMLASSEAFPPDVSEFERVGLEAVPAETIHAPMIKGAVAQLECKLVEVRPVQDMNGEATSCHMVIGQIVRGHIDKQYLTDGQVDAEAVGFVSRLGYRDHADIDEVYQMRRP